MRFVTKACWDCGSNYLLFFVFGPNSTLSWKSLRTFLSITDITHTHTFWFNHRVTVNKTAHVCLHTTWKMELNSFLQIKARTHLVFVQKGMKSKREFKKDYEIEVCEQITLNSAEGLCRSVNVNCHALLHLTNASDSKFQNFWLD